MDAPLIPDEYRELLPARSWNPIAHHLARMPVDLRADALQEAVLAHLDGKSPSAAVANFRRRETLHARRETPHAQLSSRDTAKPG